MSVQFSCTAHLVCPLTYILDRSLEEEHQSLQKKLVTSHQESSVAQERKRLATSQHYWQKKQQRLQHELDSIYRDYSHDGSGLNIRDPASATESLRKASERKEQEIKILEQKVIDLETVCVAILYGDFLLVYIC